MPTLIIQNRTIRGYATVGGTASVVCHKITRKDIAVTRITRRHAIPYHVRIALSWHSFVCLVVHSMEKATVLPKLVFYYVMSLIECQMHFL